MSIFDGTYDFLVWMPVFIWICDRLLRLFRIISFQSSSISAVGSLYYDEQSNVVELRVPFNGLSVVNPAPGMFCYLMVLDDIRTWESHPFTVAKVSSRHSKPTSREEQASLLTCVHQSEETSSIDQEAKHNCVTFIVRPYGGFTARLRDLARRTASVRVLVDGPYGTSRPVHNYDQVCFIVGGTGIVTPLSYLPSLFSQPSTPATVDVHWAVREPAFVAYVVKEHLAAQLSTDGFSLHLYTSSHSQQVEQGTVPSVYSGFAIQRSRPNIEQIVARAAANNTGKCLAVVACGPEGMLDDARLSVVAALNSCHCHIDYFQESFSW